jgi:hypothetical protein
MPDRCDNGDRWIGWRKFITLISGLAIARPLAAFAQEPKQPLKRVGVRAWLVPCPLKPDNLVIFRLWELGWNEEQHIIFDRGSAIGRVDQVPALAIGFKHKLSEQITLGRVSGSVGERSSPPSMHYVGSFGGLRHNPAIDRT